MKKHQYRTFRLMFIAILISALIAPIVCNVQAAYAMPGYTEVTGNLQFGATTVSGTQGRTVVNNHSYVAAVFGTGGWSSNSSYSFNNVDYRAAFDSKKGDWETGASYFDGAKLGYAGVEFKSAQKVTSIAYTGRKGYSANRLLKAQFQGSDNGVNYTTLYTIDYVREENYYPYGMVYVTEAEGLIANKAYKYFRITGNSGMPDVFNIVELKLYTGTGAGTGNAGYRVTPPSGTSVRGKFNNVKNSAYDPYYQNVILLNEDREYQCGAAWANDTIDLTKPFKIETYVYMYHKSGNNEKDEADGITFTMHNDTRGLKAFSHTGGTIGAGLGVYGVNYIKKALSIELDVIGNSINSGSDECVNDPVKYKAPHIAVVTPAAKIQNNDHKNYTSFTLTNKWYPFNISWTPSGSGGKLDYSFDGKSYSYTVSNTSTQFGGTKVYWGFTGTTGIYSQINAVAFKELPQDKLTVTYNPNGGTGSTIVDNVSPNTYYTIRQNTFTRAGYVFDGWNTSANGTGANYTPGQSVYLTTSLTLYAKWKACPVTVTYYPNGGTGATIVDNVNPNTYYTIRQNTFIRAGYVFDGWNTNTNGTGANYTPGQSVYLTASLTLYAKWKACLTVTYYPNGGDGATIVDNVNPSTYYTIRQNTFTRTGYAFDGWNTRADGLGTNYSPGQSVYITSSLVLYAKWKQVPMACVIYVPNGGSGEIKVVSVPLNSYYTISDQGYYWPNYTQNGWNTAPNGTGTAYQSGQTIYVTSNLVLYAQWKNGQGTQYTITYFPNGGVGEVIEVKVNANTYYTIESQDYTRLDNRFNCWNSRSDGFGIDYPVSQSILVTGNLSLYAKWVPNI
ncbi:MAG: InlB B-repeat-containing protein [Synergistaceae bacterium]|nr:InlB B-repeat-containing protein [Synergistaceae bacterium]